MKERKFIAASIIASGLLGLNWNRVRRAMLDSVYEPYL
jgi:hypothetical protein